MIELNSLFEINYGHSLDLNKLKKSKGGINFVSRTAKNNGVSASVERTSLTPISAGTITVSLGGSVLEAFLQTKEYYTGYHIFCLTSKIPMTEAQKLFYCMCIRANKYKYSYGRQANRTLKNLLVPSLDEIPSWVNQVDLARFDGAEKSSIEQEIEIPLFEKTVPIDRLFRIVNGVSATGFKEFNKPFESSVMFIRPASTHLRTFRSYISKESVEREKIFPSGTLFVSTNGEGSHTYSYVSTSEFVPNSDVAVLIPKTEMPLELKIYYAKCITANRYLFSYGRKPKGKKLKSIKIPLVEGDNVNRVVSFVRSLPYSKNL